MGSNISEYERLQLESVLQVRDVRIRPGNALFLMPDLDEFAVLYESVVEPAMRKNGLNESSILRAFDSTSALSEVCNHIFSAEVIVADLTDLNQDLMYVLGLCHGFGRCPIQIVSHTADLPFNLQIMRCITYTNDAAGLSKLRSELTRVFRVFLTASRAKPRQE